MTGEPEPPGDRVRGEGSTWAALGPRRGPWWLVLLCDLAGQAARAREADRGRTALLATISHDLRAPLAAAKAAVSGLRSRHSPHHRRPRRIAGCYRGIPGSA